MRRTARHAQWFASSLLVLTVLSAVPGQGQPPGGGGRGGFGGGPPDPDQIWGFMSQGKDSIDLNQNSRMKSSMERNGDPIPPNGILTKDQFKANFARRLAQGGGGRAGPAVAAPAAVVTVQTPPGQPAFGGGAPGGADWVESRFRDSDKNKDGFVTMDEASDRLKPVFAQADKNGDGKIDVTEYKGYMAERMGGSGGPGGMAQASQFQPPQQDGNPGFAPSRPSRREDEETPRVSVARYGKLPKEVPGFFTEMDDDRDGMVGLYEWRRHGRKSAEFVEMDLNADGYLTADEWVRYNRLAIEKRDQESLADKSPVERTTPTASRAASPDKAAGDKSERGGKGKDRESKGKPANPFNTGK